MTYSDTEIAEAVRAPTIPFTPEKGALSTLFRWFADDSRLCVIAPDLGMKASSTDVGFAHALGHLGDRDLIVVFPEAGAEAVSHRLPFLEIPARCIALTGDGVMPVERKRPADVIARYAGIRGGTHDVTAGLKLVAPLVSWLSGRGGLVEDDRKSYRTWQYKGRQVLTLRMSAGDEAELVAGVNYSDPKPGLEPVVLRLTSTMSDAQLALVQTAIEVACERRDSGADHANAEHLLQEQLRTEWKPLGLKAAPLREVPVRRPVSYGYIDLVGAGVDGRIHVVETKLGPLTGAAARWADAGVPLPVPAAALAAETWQAPSGTDVFVCENPSVVEAAAAKLGKQCPPLVCVSGVPGRAMSALLASSPAVVPCSGTTATSVPAASSSPTS